MFNVFIRQPLGFSGISLCTSQEAPCGMNSVSLETWNPAFQSQLKQDDPAATALAFDAEG